MLAALISLWGIAPPEPALTATYCSHEEVRWIGEEGGSLFAGTGSGLLKLVAGTWKEVSPRVPWPVVGYKSGTVTTAGGTLHEAVDGEWRKVGTTNLPPPSDTVTCVTPDGTIEARLGSQALVLQGGKSRPGPPADKVYAMASYQGALYVGTSEGLWVESAKGWNQARLPTKLPVQRLHGLTVVGDTWLVGGPDGLWDGTPGKWRKLDPRPVRQIAAIQGMTWVLFGDGSIDKLDIAKDRRYDDVLHGAVKRPWAASLAVGDVILFGGQGGWTEKTATSMTENRPPELEGQVATAVLSHRGTVYVGTQRTGLWTANGASMKNVSLLEGLADTWVTSLAAVDGRVFVGTSHGGLARVEGSRAVPVPTPSVSINHLVVWRSMLVFGGNHGAWMSVSGRWLPLGPPETETTGFAFVGGGLFVLTPYGAYRYDYPV